MLVPNSDYIIIKLDKSKEDIHPGRPFEGTVYSVGQTNFTQNPIGGDGQQFTFARLPEAFPLRKGDRVVVGGFLHVLHHDGENYAICFKSEVFVAIRDEQEEINLFNMEMQEQPPQLLKG